MSNIIYSKHGFKIIKVSKRGKTGFIVYNTNKVFEQGHTHVNNFNTCKHLIWCCRNHFVDTKLNPYLIKSLIRLTKDLDYLDKLTKLLKEKF